MNFVININDQIHTMDDPICYTQNARMPHSKTKYFHSLLTLYDHIANTRSGKDSDFGEEYPPDQYNMINMYIKIKIERAKDNKKEIM